MKVQQAQVSLDVINDSSDYVMMSEKNGRLSQVSELVIYTQVSGKKYHPTFRLFDNVKGELRAVMNIFYFVLFYSMFYRFWGFIELLSPTVDSVIYTWFIQQTKVSLLRLYGFLSSRMHLML